MIINDEKFKNKIIKELNDLIDKHNIQWKKLNDNLDYMCIVKYSDSMNNIVKFYSIMYRVCSYNNTYRIMIYDYDKKNKNSATDTMDLPCIEVCENRKSGDIYSIIKRVEEYCNNEKNIEEEKFLNKLSICLNKQK